jgi:hypothetical protein
VESSVGHDHISVKQGEGFGFKVDGIIEQSLKVERNGTLALPGVGVPGFKNSIGRRTRDGHQEFSSIDEFPVVQARGRRIENQIGSFQPSGHVPDT